MEMSDSTQWQDALVWLDERVETLPASQLLNQEGLPQVLDESTVRALITTWLAELFRRSPDRVAWVFYRLDLPESKVREKLARGPSPELLPELVELVLERLRLCAVRRQVWDGHFDVAEADLEDEWA